MGFRTWLSDCISKKALLIAFVHWYVTFFIEKNFFVTSTLEKPFIVIAKLFVVVCFWQIAFYMARRYKQDPEYRRYIHFAGAYFIFSMVLLLLIWPGNWLSDDLYVLEDTKNFLLRSWQHYLTGTFYYIAVFLFPACVSIIIFQLLCISLIVGYFINAIYTFTNHSKLALLAYIPFFFPTVLTENYYPLRAVLFSYLILFFITSLLINNKKEKISNAVLISLSFITAIICNLRGEGATFLLIAPTLVFLLLKRQTNLKQKFGFIALLFLFAFLIGIPQKTITPGLGNVPIKLHTNAEFEHLYKLTTIITPLGNLVNKATNDDRHDLIKDIDPLLNISEFKNANGVDALWNGKLLKPSFYHTNFKVFYKTLFELIKAYPMDFLSERVRLFKNSKNPYLSIPEINPNLYSNLLNTDTPSSYINKDLRARVMDQMDLWPHPKIKKIFHNILPPIILLIFIASACMLKKKYAKAITLLSCITPATLVFFTAPSPFFMYYFSIYLTGYAFAFGALSIALSKFINQLSKP